MTSEIETKLSSTEVMMCTPRNTSASSETLRCRESIMKRGQFAVLRRRTSATPSASEPVSSTSETAPVARVRYQAIDGPTAASDALTAATPRPS